MTGPDDEHIVELVDVPMTEMILDSELADKAALLLSVKKGEEIVIHEGVAVFRLYWDEETQDVAIESYVYDGDLKILRFMSPNALADETIGNIAAKDGIEGVTLGKVIQERPLFQVIPGAPNLINDRFAALKKKETKTNN